MRYVQDNVVGLDKAKVDQYVELLDTIKQLKKQADVIKQQIVKCNTDIVYGYKYKVIRTCSQQNRLDTKFLKEEYGLDWFNNHCFTTDITKYTAKEI